MCCRAGCETQRRVNPQSTIEAMARIPKELDGEVVAGQDNTKGHLIDGEELVVHELDRMQHEI